MVEKSATPTQVFEPGGDVNYSVSVTNQALATSVTLTNLVEDPDNDSSTDNSITYAAADVCAKTLLGAGESTTCTFTGSVSGNQKGQSFTDKACVSGVDSNGGNIGPSCATATVSIADIVPTAAITETVDGLVCSIVRYKVKVDDTDSVESLALTVLDDDQYGDLATVQGLVLATTCTLPQTIAASSSYQGTFDAKVCSTPKTSTVTATLSYNDGNSLNPSDDVTVTLSAQ